MIEIKTCKRCGKSYRNLWTQLEICIDCVNKSLRSAGREHQKKEYKTKEVEVKVKKVMTKEEVKEHTRKRGNEYYKKHSKHIQEQRKKHIQERSS